MQCPKIRGMYFFKKLKLFHDGLKNSQNCSTANFKVFGTKPKKVDNFWQLSGRKLQLFKLKLQNRAHSKCFYLYYWKIINAFSSTLVALIIMSTCLFNFEEKSTQHGLIRDHMIISFSRNFSNNMKFCWCWLKIDVLSTNSHTNVKVKWS